MKQYLQNSIKIFLPKLGAKISFELFLSILCLGLILWQANKLREYNYAQVPLPGETRDEYSFGWLGLSLIQQKYPIAWSGIGAYENTSMEHINVDHIFDVNPNQPDFPIDKPWFDHPPLFGLVVGGYAHLKGVNSFEDASVIILRRPMLKIALLNIALVFWLASALFNKKTGLVAALLMACIPLIAISSRLALAENGYLPFFLGSVISVDYYLKTKKTKYWLFSLLVGLLAMLMKLSGGAVFIFLFLIAALYGGKKRKKLMAQAVIGAFIAFFVFCLYGFYYDWHTFLNVLSVNAQRFYGSSSEIMLHAIAKSKVVNGFTDGWILTGWISFFVVASRGWMKSKSIMILTLAIFSYAIVYVLFGSEPYGWYRLPFYPFLVISTAYALLLFLKEKNIPLYAILFMLPLGTSLHRLVGVEGFQAYVPVLRCGTLFSLLSLALYFYQPKFRFLINIIWIMLLALSVFTSVKLIYFYDVNKWYFAT